MITKAIIVKNIDEYSSQVRIPIYHKAKESAGAVPDKDLPVAYYCMPPGTKPEFKPGEIVWVNFELDDKSAPVIIGSLVTQSNTSASNIKAVSLDVEVNSNIPDIKQEYISSGSAQINELPDQSGNEGKYLRTDGTNPSWEEVDSLPSQSGQSGKFLTTNGATASWSATGDLPLSGGTMTGQIKTSFGEAVAMGTRGSIQQSIPDLVNEVRYSSGVGGSFYLAANYTLNSTTMPAGWYNYLWIPHRSGGVNGQASLDNCDYGMLLMNGMTGALGCYMLRYTLGAIAELQQLDGAGLPDQSGQNGKVLTTNGSTPSWMSLPIYNGAVI